MYFTGTDDTYADSKYSSSSLSGGVSNGENGVTEPGVLMEVLTRLDIDLAYTSEKLLNLDLYMAITSLRENGFGELSEQKNISEVEIEEVLVFDLLFGYLDSEVTELGHFLNYLQTKIVDAHQKVYSCRQRRDMFNVLHEKLHGCQSSWKFSQEKLSEMKQQLTNLQKILALSELNSTYSVVEENLQSYGFDLQTAEQQRFVLRMLEKSIAGQLDLEKQLLESKEREEELKMKLLFRNEVISEMETFTEVALERALEAEHSSEIYMWNLKEVLSRLQILQFNLHCSVRREEELESKFQSCLNQLKIKETALLEIESNYSKWNQRLQDKETLEEKVKVLEGKLQSLELKLQEAKASYEASQEQLSVMENAVEALRERILLSESRAHEAETKLTTLTEENLELKEEVGFLKGGDNNEEKMSLLEKQVREFEAQLQNARTQSEASLEQQHMLYTAIWDMETLIEELRSKVSKAENQAEKADEKCVELAETNAELNKEISILKSQNEDLEGSLKEADREKTACVSDINNGAKLITDLVMQLATERERIQKQISYLSRENKILMDELLKLKAKQEHNEKGGKEFNSVVGNVPYSSSGGASTFDEIEEIPSSACASNQVDDEPSEQNMIDDAEAAESSISVDDEAPDVNLLNNEDQTKERRNLLYKKSCMFAAILAVVLSVIAMNINWHDLSIVLRHLH